ncbi:MAG: formate C-acetyltransferase [Clostridiales bacterium]|jgi:formate C-acetyltransferase|nr:formate C-acetyltransferase [Clostridiales bacterium]
MKQWEGFKGTEWRDNIDVRGFIRDNYAPYTGGAEFLAPPTARTQKLSNRYDALLAEERKKGGVLDVDTERVSSLLSYPPGYLDKDNEIIVGLQTAAPLCRGVNPFGGIRMARNACEAYGYKLSDAIETRFEYKTTHNDGVFRVYTDEMLKLRKYGVTTSLPDAYGRGRIIGDYRRVALYGVDRLIADKKKDFAELGKNYMSDDNIRLREDVFRQVGFLDKLRQMALMYGVDISGPASNTLEAVQWTYFAYLGAIKEQNGAAMSLGRTSTFFDVYAERDLKNKVFTESEIQEIIDQFVLKLRMGRQLRTPEYNELFAGDPTWVTESVGGVGTDGRPLVTKTSYRFLHTLFNLGTSPEPNLTVLWSKALPKEWKKYCASVSMRTSAVQYENDDLMRPRYGDDYGIACCVSAMTIGKQMQFFGARCNIAKLLLIALNGGRDELTGVQIGPAAPPMTEGPLDYGKVKERYFKYIDWLSETYVNTMNIIHYMHDKYAYEKLQMALHDTFVERLMAFGAAGISVAADSLSAIKYARVTPVADETGLIVDYKTEGDFPKFGNDDDRVDKIAEELTEYFSAALKRTPCYRGAVHTLSLLTITSNVVYGKKTGATPCGRKSGAPFAPGANPLHNRETKGALASLNSVAKIRYDCCRDGISNTFSVVPVTLGKDDNVIADNLVAILDGYFANGGHHLNMNVYNKEKLLDAHKDPEKYPNLTIRVSGYAVRFGILSTKHREEVLSRTFFDRL